MKRVIAESKRPPLGLPASDCLVTGIYGSRAPSVSGTFALPFRAAVEDFDLEVKN